MLLLTHLAMESSIRDGEILCVIVRVSFIRSEWCCTVGRINTSLHVVRTYCDVLTLPRSSRYDAIVVAQSAVLMCLKRNMFLLARQEDQRIDLPSLPARFLDLLFLRKMARSRGIYNYRKMQEPQSVFMQLVQTVAYPRVRTECACLAT